MFNVGQKVIYVDCKGKGYSARVICTDRVASLPVVVLVDSACYESSKEFVICVRADGKYSDNGRVVIKPAPVRVSKFSNVVKDGIISYNVFGTMEECLRGQRCYPTVNYAGVIETVFINGVFNSIVYHPCTEADKPAY